MRGLWGTKKGRSTRLELGRVQAVRPAVPGGRRGGVRPYSAWDLRAVLAFIPMRLSTGRRLSALVPLILGAVGWFTIPSWAAELTHASGPGQGAHMATVLSAVACPPPVPVVGILGPPAVGSGQTATYIVTAQREDEAAGAPSVVVIDVPSGFSFAAPPPGATVSGSSMTVTLNGTPPTQAASIPIGIVAPAELSEQNPIKVALTATAPSNARCPSRQAQSQSVMRTGVVPAGAVAGVQSGPINVSAPQPIAPGPSLHSPVTGVNTGMLRAGAVGLALIVAGLIVITGIRRNPHAMALRARR